jgi:hypothetical protein
MVSGNDYPEEAVTQFMHPEGILSCPEVAVSTPGYTPAVFLKTAQRYRC